MNERANLRKFDCRFDFQYPGELDNTDLKVQLYNDGSGASPRSIHRLQIVLILAIPVIESGFTVPFLMDPYFTFEHA